MAPDQQQLQQEEARAGNEREQPQEQQHQQQLEEVVRAAAGGDDDDPVVGDVGFNNSDREQYQQDAERLYQGAALAPMVRASSTPLRLLALQYGAHVVYTEELVDRSLSETVRVVNPDLGTIDYVKDLSKLSKKTQKKLAREDRPCLILRIFPKTEHGKLICQLGTGEPELALKAAQHIYQDVSAIDINMGCPKKFSVSGGMGSALLQDPDRAAKIISTLARHIPRPISCKIRLLETSDDTVKFVGKMIQAGVNAVAIHARRVGHDATLEADWSTLREVLGVLRPKYPKFPFLVNGDFYDRDETQQLLKDTGANGVLLGRPALYNVSMFLPIHKPLQDKTKVIQEYIQLATKFDIHYKNAKYVVCEMMNNRRAPTERIPTLPQDYPGGQTISKTCSCNNMKAMCQVWNVDYESAKQIVTSETLNPGEHRYDDAYLLKRSNDNNNDDNNNATHTDEPNAKRQKQPPPPATPANTERLETTTTTTTNNNNNNTTEEKKEMH